MTDLEKHLAKIDAAIAKAKATEAAAIREINGLPGPEGGTKAELRASPTAAKVRELDAKRLEAVETRRQLYALRADTIGKINAVMNAEKRRGRGKKAAVKLDLALKALSELDSN